MPNDESRIHQQGMMSEVIEIARDAWRSLTVTDKKLLEACETGNLEELHSLLSREANPNARNAEGKTALMLAGSFGINDSQPGYRDTAFEMVCALIRAGADIEARDNKGNTALILASRNGRLGIVDALVRAGADVNAENRKGYTGLMRANKHGYAETADYLIAHGAQE